MVAILTEDGEFDADTASGQGLWLKAGDVARATGWTLKPEGMCRDDVCVPMPASAMRDGWVDVEAFWKKLGAPVVSDSKQQVWVLGRSAADSAAALEGLKAPDFTLPDINGNLHTLSALRGRKVFLSTWASW